MSAKEILLAVMLSARTPAEIAKAKKAAAAWLVRRGYPETTRRWGVGAARSALPYCWGDAGWLAIVDVWDSQEHFERFGQTLMPLLEETGFLSVEPEPWPVHNVIVD